MRVFTNRARVVASDFFVADIVPIESEKPKRSYDQGFLGG